MAQAPNAIEPTGDGDYAELRSLLLAPEQSRLEELQEQVEHIELNAQNVSRLLPDAIALRGEHDQAIITYLTPTHERAILRSSEWRIANDDQADSNTLPTDAAVFDRRSLQRVLAGTPLAEWR